MTASLGSSTQKPVRDIELALSWAYRDELPKVHRQNRVKSETDGPRLQPSPLLHWMTLGTPIDSWSREPGFPLAMGDPHPDALKIEAAVARLGDAPLVWSPDEYGAELAGLVPHLETYGEAALRRIGEHVMIRAKLGDRPPLSEPPRAGPCASPVNGKTAVRQLGANAAPDPKDLPTKAIRKNVYASGSYCPLLWLPDPAEIVHERAEYLLWWLALEWLSGELQDLQSIIIIPPAAPRRPWADPAARRGKQLLKDLRASA